MGTSGMCSRELSEKIVLIFFILSSSSSGLSWRFLKFFCVATYSHSATCSRIESWNPSVMCLLFHSIYPFISACLCTAFFSSCCTHFGLPLMLASFFAFLQDDDCWSALRRIIIGLMEFMCSLKWCRSSAGSVAFAINSSGTCDELNY